MRRSLIAAALAAALALPFIGTTPASADTHVDGYTRNDGTYVPGHYRSSPNSSTADNWSTRGNQNPYTGEWGTRSPSYSSPSYSYPSYGSGYGSGYGSYWGR